MRFPAPFHLLKGYFSKLTPEGKQMCSEISIHARPERSSVSAVETGEVALAPEHSLGIIPTWGRARRGPPAGPSGGRFPVTGTMTAGWVCEDETPASSSGWPLRRPSDKHRGKCGVCPASYFLEPMRLISHTSFLCGGDIFSSRASVPWKSCHNFPWNIRSFSDERL